MKILSQALILLFLYPFIFSNRINIVAEDGEFSYDCHPFGSVSNSAAILPRHDVYVEVGLPLTTFCHLNPKFNLTSDKIYFTKNFGSEEILESTIVDDYTIMAHIIDIQPVKYFLICRSVDQILCVREISIGYSPLNVSNFHCVSFNWQVLTCAYNLLVNPAQGTRDDYFVSYTTEKNESEQQIGYKCPNIPNKTCCPLNGEECWKWGTSAYYPYEKFSQTLYIQIYSENPLGKKSFIYKINQYEIMISQNVKKLRALSLSARKIKIEFELPVFLRQFPPGITYKLIALCLWNEHYLVETVHNVSKVEAVIGVQWPGQEYKIDVLLRSGNRSWSSLEEDDGWWSKSYPHDVTVATPPASPWAAPDVTPGIFQIIHNNDKNEFRSVIVAWKKMEEFLHGGKNFSYRLETLSGDKKINVTPYQVTESFAIFENLSSMARYRFLITPENEVGVSNSTAVVVVESEAKEWKELFFPLVVHHERERVVELRWFTEDEEFQNFTLFWCDDASPDLKSPCMKNLNWIYLSNIRAVNLTYETLSVSNSLTNLRFALSSTSKNQKGMIWASCTLMDVGTTHSTIVSAPIIAHKNSSLVVVAWDLDCSHWRKNPTGCEIFWCKGKVQSFHECLDFGFLRAPIWPQEVFVEGFDPNSFYTIWLKVFFEGNSVDVSFPAFFTTEPEVLSPFKIVLLVAYSLLVTIAVILGITCGVRKIIKILDEATRTINISNGLLPKNISSNNNLPDDKMSALVSNPLLGFLSKFIPHGKDVIEDKYSENYRDGSVPLVQLPEEESSTIIEEFVPLKSIASASVYEFPKVLNTNLDEETSNGQLKKQDYYSHQEWLHKTTAKVDSESPSPGYILAVEFMRQTMATPDNEPFARTFNKTEKPLIRMGVPEVSNPLVEFQQPLIIPSESLFCSDSIETVLLHTGKAIPLQDPPFTERNNLTEYDNKLIRDSEDHRQVSDDLSKKNIPPIFVPLSNGYVQAHEFN